MTMRKGSRVSACELRYHGEYGVEAQFCRDGTFFSGRRFDTKAQALALAELERQALAKLPIGGSAVAAPVAKAPVLLDTGLAAAFPVFVAGPGGNG